MGSIVRGLIALLVGCTVAGAEPETLATAAALDARVEQLLKEGAADPAECIELAARASAIRERLQGPRHADLGDTLIRLGAAERTASRFADARKHFERALTILTEARGAADPSTSRARLGLAAVYTELADYPRARAIFADEIALLERTLGPDHRDLAKVYFNAARVARRAGDYRDAERLYEQALAIAERESSGTEPLFVAFVMNGLGNLRDDQARYTEARDLYDQAIARAEKQVGPDHPFVASCVNNLALVLKRLGDLDAAARYFRRALDVARRAHPEDHPFTASSLANLAELEGLRGNFDEGLTLAREARAMRERLYGSMHPEIAGSLRLEAMLERERGRPGAAVPLYESAVAIVDSTLGPDHAEVADVLGGLAAALAESGDLARARAAQERAVATCERGVGGHDPRTGDALRALASLQHQGGDVAAAREQAMRAESVSRTHARLVVGALSENEALRYSDQRQAARDLLLTLFAEAPDAMPAADVWNAVIGGRSLVLDEIAVRHRSLAAEGGEKVRALEERHTAASRALAELLVAGPASDVAIYRAAVDAARKRRDEVERDLAKRSVSFRARRDRDRVDFAKVCAALPADCALVAYSCYDHGVGDHDPSPRYMAFVLRAGGAAIAVPLGRAATIDHHVDAWSAAVAEPDSGAGRGAAAKAARAAGEALRRLAWDPLAAHVAGARTLLVVPDGALHCINFAALPRREGGYLLDDGTRFHELLAERDVVPAPRGDGRREGRGILVVGGVDFSHGAADGSSRFRFETLPATATEAKSVAALWSTRGPGSRDAREKAYVLTGADADEAAVKRLAPGRRALHLATHGVMLAPASSTALASSTSLAPRPGTRGIGALGSDAAASAAEAAGADPLLPLSGLALAGANAGRSGAGDTEDGILTAEEIAALDLSGTEWAVLSACDTGRGEVRPGEGVLGLRRAFEVTGVETLILSLWSVDDESTRQWMDALYEARLGRGRGALESVDSAYRAVLAARRANGQSDHPFYWAAFVAAGEWR